MVREKNKSAFWEANASGPVIVTKIANKANVVAFHDNASRNEHAPCDCLGIELNALHQAHLLLFGSGSSCIFDDGPVRLWSAGVVVRVNHRIELWRRISIRGDVG